MWYEVGENFTHNFLNISLQKINRAKVAIIGMLLADTKSEYSVIRFSHHRYITEIRYFLTS